MFVIMFEVQFILHNGEKFLKTTKVLNISRINTKYLVSDNK